MQTGDDVQQASIFNTEDISNIYNNNGAPASPEGHQATTETCINAWHQYDNLAFTKEDSDYPTAAISQGSSPTSRCASRQNSDSVNESFADISNIQTVYGSSSPTSRCASRQNSDSVNESFADISNIQTVYGSSSPTSRCASRQNSDSVNESFADISNIQTTYGSSSPTSRCASRQNSDSVNESVADISSIQAVYGSISSGYPQLPDRIIANSEQVLDNNLYDSGRPSGDNILPGNQPSSDNSILPGNQPSSDNNILSGNQQSSHAILFDHQQISDDIILFDNQQFSDDVILFDNQHSSDDDIMFDNHNLSDDILFDNQQLSDEILFGNRQPPKIIIYGSQESPGRVRFDNKQISDSVVFHNGQPSDSILDNNLHPSSEDMLRLGISRAIARRRHQSEGIVYDRKRSIDATSTQSIVTSMTSVSGSESSSLYGSYHTLIYSRHEAVAPKDFYSEARASMDVSSFVKNMALLLDVDKTSVDDIVEACLVRALEDVKNPEVLDQARSAMFTHDLVHQLSHTLQGTSITEDGVFDYDHNWICAMCTIGALTSRKVCVARLLHPANLGTNCQEVHFLIVILVPRKEKETKSELEVARTFGTIFSDIEFRQDLLQVSSEKAFEQLLVYFCQKLADRHSDPDMRIDLGAVESRKETVHFQFLRGISGDLRRRLPHYLSDYKDGVADRKSISKTVSCTLFLYFACVLPCIAFGILNSSNTKGVLTVEKAFCSQVFGGIIFAVFGGTPNLVLLATAPLALYTQIIFILSVNFGLNFEAFFACTGLFNCVFLLLFSVFDLSMLMQFSTRSSEEIFAMFVSIAFSVDVYRNFAQNFNKHYCDAPVGDIRLAVNATLSMSSNSTDLVNSSECAREISLLYLLLLLGTFCLGVTLYTFRSTPYLTAAKRELLADFSLPVTVFFMAIVGVFAFKDVKIGKSFEPLEFYSSNFFTWADLTLLPWQAVLGACGLGFCLSLLIFMDQNIAAAVVNAPRNKLRKGTAYHWDLLVIAAINVVLSMLCFPLVHASLPHSALHVQALADVEERVDGGKVQKITVKVRETRLTAILSHVLIGLSLLILSMLAYIPTPVLYGMFLCIAATALFNNQLFERVLLIVTEQSAYPPNHYIRRVPQRKMHTFTCLQLAQLAVLVAIGFTPYPYIKLFFPVVIFLLIPSRQKLIPKVIEQKYLQALDGDYK